MASFTYFIRCIKCEAKAVGTLHAHLMLDGVYCAACGEKALRDFVKSEMAKEKKA